MNNRLLAVIGIVVFWALGALQGQRIHHIREAETFYRWINSAATNERILGEDNEEFKDGALFEELVDATSEVLSGIGLEQKGDISKLSLLTESTEYDDLLFALTRSDTLKKQRETFFEYARNGELEYVPQGGYGVVNEDTEVPLFSMYFGFRKVAANFVWIQVDSFWHRGMTHRMIPLMKTCVTLDPQFIDAYLLGAWHLSYNITAKMDPTPMPQREWVDKWQACVGEKESYYYLAIDLLKRGILNNPRNYKLYFDLGFAVYKNKLEDYDNAVLYLAEAVRLPHEKWVPRQLYICLELTERYEEALNGWTQYLERYPEHEVAQRFIERNKGHIQEQLADAAKEQALATSDPAEAEKFMQIAEQHYVQARQIWTDLNEPYAEARIMRMDAIAFAEQGRYREAIAFLEKARMESNNLFWEASNLIIEYKQAKGIALTTSEKLALLREQDGETCPGMPTTMMGTETE